MKRRLILFIIVITLLFPVFFAFRSQAITYWLTGPNYRIKESAPGSGRPATANSARLISLDFIDPDLSRLPFLLDLSGRHVFGGSPFTAEFFPGGAILIDQDNRVGVISDEGEIIIDFLYDRIRYSDDTLMAVAAGQPTVYFTAQGQPLFQTSQELQTPFSEGLVYLSNGVHNRSGEMIFNPEAPILNGFRDGVAAAETGSEIILYQTDGTQVARLPYAKVYDWWDSLVLVGDDTERFVVDYQNDVKLTLTLDPEGQFRLTTPEGNDFGGLSYDLIEMVDPSRLLLCHRLTYRYFSLDGAPLSEAELSFLEPFEDGYSLTQSGGQVHVYNEAGERVKSIEGAYVPDSMSEGSFVVVRQSLNGGDSHYLYTASGQQKTYRPLSRIMPRSQGINLVFEADKGVGYIRDESVTEWVFVPSLLVTGAKISLPIGLLSLAGLILFMRRYRL